MKEGVRCDRKSNRAKALAMKDGVSYENGIIFRVCRAIISGRGFLTGAENEGMGFSAYPDPWRSIWSEKLFWIASVFSDFKKVVAVWIRAITWEIEEMTIDIDVNFDFRHDTPTNKDIDAYSKTLKKYHRKLWSKSLPDGSEFILEEKGYLYHRSQLGEFYLGSDAITHSYKNTKRLSKIAAKVPDVAENIFNQGCKIAAYTLFPSKQVKGKMTINQARGVNAKIKDRFDLTLECIRLFYEGEATPLTDTFNRYENFFRLFNDFKGYVNFFLFQDLVNEDISSVKFHLPFDGFSGSPLPQSVDEYLEYAKNTEIFLRARSKRIFNSLVNSD